MKKLAIFSTSAIAIGAALSFSTPAAAQEVCTTTGTTPVASSATGTYSLACGTGSTATGDFSTAVGSYASATDTSSTAIGSYSTASGTYSTAVGENSTAGGYASTAIGQGSVANGAYSVALGSYSSAPGDFTVSVGGTGFTVGPFTRTITGVTNGAIAAGSTEAITGDQLNTVITDQATTDAAQDTALATAVSNQATTDANQNAAIAAISAGNTFDPSGLQSQINDLGGRINDVDRQASAGTALAIAMGGASFLPGKAINITGNVGTYRGAYAGAINLGALVNESVAFNAGVATNFNHGASKIGARVGVTVGW